MKATIKTKNPYTYPTYTVMKGSQVIQGFYNKADAQLLRNMLNQQEEVKQLTK